MLKKRYLRLPLQTALIVALCVGGATVAMALTNWNEFNSPQGLFTVKVPAGAKDKVFIFHTDYEQKVYTEEVIATADQRPYKNVVKNFIVKFEETLGSGISENESINLINKELDFYADQYSLIQGIQKNREIIKGDGWTPTHGEIHITYNDKSLGVQGIRAKVYFTDRAKVQQIMTGPDALMTGLEAKDFFDSLSIKGSSPSERQPIESTWVKHDSPLHMFTALLPPISPPFMPQAPRTETADHSELMKVTIPDPARSQNLFYNIYGYRMDAPLLVADAQDHLTKKHLARYVNPAGIEIKRINNKDKSIGLLVETAIKPPKGYPYVNYTRMKLQFLGNYLIVQEILGSQALATSPLADNLLSHIQFHPLEAHAFHVQQKKAGGGSVAPLATNAAPKRTVFKKPVRVDPATNEPVVPKTTPAK